MTQPTTRPSDRVIISAIAAVTLLELAAMYFGLNGLSFQTAIATLAGLAGFTLGQLLKR